jgi:hypothetical protein
MHTNICNLFHSQWVGRNAGDELERNSLPEDADTNICNLFHSQRVGRNAGDELSKLRWTRQRIAAAVVIPERRSLIRDRNTLERQPLCDPGSCFAWPG